MLRVSVVRAIFNSRISASARRMSKPRAKPPPTAVALRKVRRFMGSSPDGASPAIVALDPACQGCHAPLQRMPLGLLLAIGSGRGPGFLPPTHLPGRPEVVHLPAAGGECHC